MKRLLLLGVIAVLAGCETAEPPRAAQPAPRATPPRILHTLVLTSPASQGSLELRRESRIQNGAETVTYTTSGAIVATDDVAQWRFAYTKTSLEGAGLTPSEWIDGLRAISMIVTNITAEPLEMDWENSRFVDARGVAQRFIHRGIQLNQITATMLPSTIASGATLNEFIFPAGAITFSAPGRTMPSAPLASTWNSPAVFERLAPGSDFSIVLSVKSGGAVAQRTFKFAALAPAAK
jgi:hypothetical protein